jgi:nitrite reductase (NO-forming)
MHVANGMYGLIVVEPKEGLPKVDHEYYVMQGDFYTNGGYRAGGLQPFDMQKAVDERPTYVLFNGAEGALTGKNALTAKVGEKVRLFFGDGGPNLTSSFHVIGAIFDKVYSEGSFNHYLKDVQTTMVPAGGSTVVEFTPKVPGNLTLVDHSLIRAFNKGAIGILSVSGAEAADIYGKGVITPLGKDDADVHLALKQNALLKTSAASVAPPVQNDSAAQLKRGQQVFSSVCAACHGADGKGVEGVFPPLANSDFFKERPYEMAHIVIHGRSGEIVVNGKHYNNVMPPQDLSEEDIAAVINYVNIDKNGGKPVVTPQQVHEMRLVKQ